VENCAGARHGACFGLLQMPVVSQSVCCLALCKKKNIYPRESRYPERQGRSLTLPFAIVLNFGCMAVNGSSFVRQEILAFHTAENCPEESVSQRPLLGRMLGFPNPRKNIRSIQFPLIGFCTLHLSGKACALKGKCSAHASLGFRVAARFPSMLAVRRWC